MVVNVPATAPQAVASVIALEYEGDGFKLAPFKHAYDPVKKQIVLAAANFQAHASSIRDLGLHYEPEQQAIVGWQHNKGGGATVAWSFEVLEAGHYKVELEYALNGCSAGLPLDLLVDNRKQLAFTPKITGKDTACKQVVVGAIKLEQGRHEIAFKLPRAHEDKLVVMQLLRNVYLTKNF